MKGSVDTTEELTVNRVQLDGNKNTANKLPEGFKDLADRMIERNEKLSRVLKRPDATSVKEVEKALKELPDDRCTFDRGFGEALWATKDEAVWRIEDAFRQRFRGNWAPYFTVSKDPAALAILNVLDALEAISQKMSVLNDESKPLAIKVATAYFANPSMFPATKVEDPRWTLLGFAPVAACLPETLSGRLVAKVFNRDVCELSADEKKLAKLISELVKLNCRYSALYGAKLHGAEDRYLDSHPEDCAE